MRYDLLIAGGGPVGLYAAILAATHGMKVAIAEPKAGVIDKACGEGLMPAAVAALLAVGVAPAHQPFEGIRYIDSNRTAEGRFSRGVGWGVRRLALHSALMERAFDLGVQTERTAVHTIDAQPEGIRAAGIEARWLFAADGLHSPLRKHLGLQLPARFPRRYGIRRHFVIAPWSSFVEVHWSEQAEAYVTPVSDREVGVAFLFDDRLKGASSEPPFERLMAAFPALQERLRGTDVGSTVRGAGPFEQRTLHQASGRTLLIGDAAGYLDPITGEGLRLGFEAASLALECIEAGNPAAYNLLWPRAYRRYWWMTAGLLTLRRSPLRKVMLPALQHVPGLFTAAVNALGAEPPPKRQRLLRTPI